MRKRITIISALMLIAVMFMPCGTFAAAHDVTEDVSSDTATIYTGKVLQASQPGKFPDISDFNFRLEAVKAWDNANTDSSVSGADIPASEMPMPAASQTDHNKVTVNGTSADITVGDFKGSADTARADTSLDKFRVTPLEIRFTKAGYYMYRISETDSAATGAPGMTYDPDSYYIVVYVCNKSDTDGNTLEGVYVHDITSYRNKPGQTSAPELSDIQNKTDNGGNAAADNTEEHYGKVGKSDPEPGTDGDTGLPTGPDKLEAYKFFNKNITRDIVITNNVTGNLGDRTKEFVITVELTGLEKGVSYTTDIPAEFKDDKNITSETADIASASEGRVDPAAGIITADQNGKATFDIRLADDEVFVINALPADAGYKATEHGSDHIASYSVSSTSNEAVIAGAGTANTKDQTPIATNGETVDADKDETVTIAFVNHRNLAVITGLPYYGGGEYIAGALLAVSGAVVLIARRRRCSQ